MPLLIHAVTVWIAGLLLAAFAHSASTTAHWWNATLLLVASTAALSTVLSTVLALSPQSVFATLRPSSASYAHTLALLTTIHLAALLLGSSSARQRQRCLVALARETELRVAIDERARPNGRTTGEVQGTGPLERCRAHASLRVKNGRAPPGAIVAVTLKGTGTVRTTTRGLLLDGEIRPLGTAQTLRTWRGRLGETIDERFRENAALVRALLIADQDGIAPDVRDRFADAGLVHMLSISGLHVAIIAGALLTVAGACRLSRNAATLAALGVVTVYVVMLGAPAPAVRSAVMLATVAITERSQRPVHPWTALALGALLPTVRPDVVVDLGYQLSVSGMAALVAARAIIRRLRTAEIGDAHARWVRRGLRSFRDLRGWRSGLARELLTGVVATAVTAPLVAWTFGRVSVVAPLSNLVAGPIMALLQPALFLSMLLEPWPAAAQFVADACMMPIALLDRVATWSAEVPYAALHVAPDLAGACCVGVASAAFVRATSARHPARGLLVAAAALSLAVWSPLSSIYAGGFELHLLDVGQGDAIAMRTPRGRWILVDAGRRWEGGDAGRRVVVPYVRRRGGPVAAFVMTHAHDDHMGGAESVAKALRPARWWEPAFVSASESYRSALQTVQQAGIPWQRVRPGDAMKLDGVAVEVLAPDSSWTAAQTDANETSVILRVQYGQVVFVLTGDAESAEEAWVVANTPKERLRADVLKLGHHGSKTSSSIGFLDAVQPDVGLVSVGAGNRYGHPSPEILERFAKRGIPLLRSDRDGVIVLRTDGRQIDVEDRHGRWRLPRAVAPDG